MPQPRLSRLRYWLARPPDVGPRQINASSLPHHLTLDNSAHDC